MVLVNTKEMIKKAKEGHYAVGSFNVTDIEMIRGIVGAARKKTHRSLFSLRSCMISMCH